MRNLRVLYLNVPNVVDLFPISRLDKLENLLVVTRAADINTLSELSSLKTAHIIVLDYGKERDEVFFPPGIIYAYDLFHVGPFLLDRPTEIYINSAVQDDEGLVLRLTGPADFNALGNLTRLISLEVNYPGLSNLSPLQNLKNLKVLSIRRSSVKNLTLLSKLSQLQVLDITDTPFEDLAHLNLLPELRVLAMSSRHTDYSILNNCSKLRVLTLVEDGQFDHASSVLDALSPKTEIVSSESVGLKVKLVGRVDLSKVHNLHNVVHIDLSLTAETNFDLRSSFENLVSVEIREEQVGKVKLAHDIKVVVLTKRDRNYHMLTRSVLYRNV